MQNYPPNNAQDPNQYNQTNYESSYIQQQLNQQLMMQQGPRINVLSIMSEATRRLGKHFGNVFLGWLLFMISLVISWLILSYIIQLFAITALTSAFASTAISGFTFALFVKILFLIMLIFIVSISFSMVYYFGFLSYISDLIELDSANYMNIYSGFQKSFQIIGFVSMIVIPLILFAAALAFPFGFLAKVGSSMASTSQTNNPFTVVSVTFYSIILIVVSLLYISKLILVPNLLIAQDMTLKEAVKESWTKLKGSNYLHVCILLIVLGLISFAINIFSSIYVKPVIITPGSEWSYIWYSIVNALMVQIVFVFFIGCIAHTYNSLYPLQYKTDTIAHASKYSRQTHPKYFQPIQAQGQGHPQSHTQPPNLAQGYNAPQQDPFASKYESYSTKDNEIDSNIIEPKTSVVPKQQLEVQEAANMYKTEKKKETDQNIQPQKQKIQYISEPRKPKAPEQEEFIVVEEHELIQEPPKPQVPKGHVSKFAEKLFADEDYPTGKIVPVDAMRMMKDKNVRFIEVLFQDVKHAHTTMRKIKVFHKNPDTGEYEIRDPLSFAISIPKIASNPVKLFFGGTDMTVKELWNAKEAIIEGMGKIVKMNRGDEK